MAEITIQVSDLDQLTQVVEQDFIHIKQFGDNGDYKITVGDFSTTLAETIPLDLGDLAYLNTLPSIAGNGLTSTGTIPNDYFLNIGTPSTITRTSSNTVTTNSHTHAIDQGVTTIRGGIILFHGTFIGKSPVPLGGTVADTSWVICDGTNGTPDMRNRVPIGSGDLYPINSIGGSKDAVVVAHNHAATVNDPGHFHTTFFKRELMTRGPNASYGDEQMEGQSSENTNVKTTGISVGIVNSGVSGVDKNLPPYRALAFIMKV
jgi:hypothetical protein